MVPNDETNVSKGDSLATWHRRLRRFESWDFTARDDANAQPVGDVMSVGEGLGDG